VKTITFKGKKFSGIKSCCIEHVRIPKPRLNTFNMELVPDLLLTVSFLDKRPDCFYRGKDAAALEAKVRAAGGKVQIKA
jgi:hypothetical protein